MADATIHAILDAEREAKQMTPAALARESGLPASTVYDVLNGRRPDPTMTTLLALLAGLGRDLHWLHKRGVRPERIPNKITE